MSQERVSTSRSTGPLTWNDRSKVPMTEAKPASEEAKTLAKIKTSVRIARQRIRKELVIAVRLQAVRLQKSGLSSGAKRRTYASRLRHDNHRSFASFRMTVCFYAAKLWDSTQRFVLTPKNLTPAAKGLRPFYCSTTWSPSFSPCSNSVLAPFDIPMLTASFRLPSLAFGSGTSTDAFLSLS